MVYCLKAYLDLSHFKKVVIAEDLKGVAHIYIYIYSIRVILKIFKVRTHIYMAYDIYSTLIKT